MTLRLRTLFLVRPAALAVALAVALAGCGAGSTSTAPSSSMAADGVRTIEVVATDGLRFEPAAFTVRSGERVRFVVVNRGSGLHEFYVGDEAEQLEHDREMASGAMHHGDANGIEIEPGQTGHLEFTFGEPGALLAGCHIPGHYEAGMVATITVEP